MEFHVEVLPEDRGQTAFQIVAAHLQDFLEHFIQKLFSGGHVHCGRSIVRPEQLPPPGTSLTIEVPEGLAPNISPKPYPVKFLLEDDRVLAVDKPAGLSMLPGLGFEPVSLFEAVWHHLKGTGHRPRIVNRVDKGTSGVVLFARDREAQSHLCGQFQRREVRKLYRALVRGTLRDDAGEIDLPLAPHPGRPEMMTVDQRLGRPSKTLYRVVRRFERFTELEVEPVTGRTHQIRVHFAAIEHPLVVDPVYGTAEPLLLSTFKRGYRHKDGVEHPLMARTPLHAEKLSFTHPADGRPVSLVAPLPKDMAVCLKQLAKWDRYHGNAAPPS